MQIDILSSNTLKLTLSRLDMFDLDIKYESLSGKNPETKRLLAHVLKSIRLDQKVGFDFSCERIFVEAFPRPDGGCMLYVSSLESDSGKKKRTHPKPRETIYNLDESPITTLTGAASKAGAVFKTETAHKTEAVSKAASLKRENLKTLLILETEGMKELGCACKSLCLQKEWERIGFESALYLSEKAENKYRLIIKGDSGRQSLISGIIKEYGEPLRGERELMHTKEHFKPLIEENAAERLNELF
ncbi:MAG: adaptor protein MecA [Oscillospiraceae bacterium]|nr:adaptor protein MecA [Oscillospiraceae bacterium]